MSPRAPVDKPLVLFEVDVNFLDGSVEKATAEGNNSAWKCKCDKILVGRCYYQFGDTCYTVCPVCEKKYRVFKDSDKRACKVDEIS